MTQLTIFKRVLKLYLIKEQRILSVYIKITFQIICNDVLRHLNPYVGKF
jgi:hypothetical protein